MNWFCWNLYILIYMIKIVKLMGTVGLFIFTLFYTVAIQVWVDREVNWRTTLWTYD